MSRPPPCPHLLEHSREGFLLLDGAARIACVNLEAARILDVPRAGLIGRICWDALPSEISAPISEYLQIVPLDAPPRGSQTLPAFSACPVRAAIEVRVQKVEGGLAVFLWESKEVVPSGEKETGLLERRQQEFERQFLSRATEALASSLDYERTLQRVTELAVPHIAEWCVVDMLEDDGSIRLLAVAHVDPEKVKLVFELRERYPLVPDDQGIWMVIRTGRSETYPYIAEELYEIGARDADHLAMLHRVGLRSVMIVAIKARDRILGAITFIATKQSGRQFTTENLALAEGLAARAALAIDNALLYRTAQEELAERRRTQKALQERIRENERLNARLHRSVRETHHRVKNNLQIISAMLDMQVMQHETSVPIDEISRLRQHIKALAAIHDLLTHQAKGDTEVTSLSVKSALQRLMPLLQAMVDGRNMDFTVQEADIPVRHGTTLAVLVNELVSNAIKHGTGRIGVRFAASDGQAVLEVTNEGAGFPDGFDPVTAANTGLELIESLTHYDLAGAVTYDNLPEGGAQVRIRFPLADPTPTGGEQ